MTGALDGLVVLDLSRSIAGSIASMLLADQGATVVKVEPSEGDPVRSEPGAQVWMRNKLSIVVDLPSGADRVLELARDADGYIDSWIPDRAASMGLPDDRLAATNPGLVRCSITAYGAGNRHSTRPDDPALVAARTGLMWEQKGWVGGPIARLSGAPPRVPDLPPPPGCWDGAERVGPVFPAVPQPAVAAGFLGALALAAALYRRGSSGVGQKVETSLFQGVLAATWGAWQRVERVDAPNYDSWVFDSRAHRGHFECADGRWVCHWVPRPAFVLGVSQGDALDTTVELPPIQVDPARILPDPHDLVALHHFHPLLATAFRRFPAGAWADVAAAKDAALQPVRSPEEALRDPLLAADGSVISVPDPRLGGRITQPGLAIRLHACDPGLPSPPPVVGQDNGAGPPGRAAPSPPASEIRSAGPPLAGLLVVDLGLAVAGPWGTQMLSDLGAQVIKVNRKSDQFWHASHMAMACNRGKRSLAVNLRRPEGQDVLRRLVARADVVHTNMRPAAAAQLGVSYEHLKVVNPSLIYCHTTGFDDSRANQPGNDQTGAALAGVLHADGGCDRGGRPAWSLTSLGDVGNGFLSAIGVLFALLHRQRTGEGQLVTTSIVRAHLLGASAWLHPDGSPGRRDLLDAEQLGFSALRRLYEGATGWLCVSVRTEADWAGLCGAIGRPDLLMHPSYRDAAGRAANDDKLSRELAATFARRPAEAWAEVLDDAGVPSEVCDPDTALGLFDDQELVERRWVTSYEQPIVGRLSQLGLLFDFSLTPAAMSGPPLVVGDGTRAVLTELGYGVSEIEALEADKVVYDCHDA